MHRIGAKWGLRLLYLDVAGLQLDAPRLFSYLLSKGVRAWARPH